MSDFLLFFLIFPVPICEVLQGHLNSVWGPGDLIFASLQAGWQFTRASLVVSSPSSNINP